VQRSLGRPAVGLTTGRSPGARGEPEACGDHVLADGARRARARGAGRAGDAELDPVVSHLDRDGIGGDQRDVEGVEILGRAPQQPLVGQRGPRLVVEPPQHRHQIVEGTHEVTATSQVASWLGVRAAISIPRSASRCATARS
jgi:hypothetical protein